MARPNDGKKAQDAGRDRIGQQDGACHLGDDDEKRGLSRTGAGGNCISLTPAKKV